MTIVNRKVIIVGAKACGKTQLIERVCKNQFNSTYDATIGVEFTSKTEQALEGVAPNSSLEIYTKLQFWTTSGDERYAMFTAAYYLGSELAICCVDLSRQIDEDYIKTEIALIKEKCPDIKVFLVGTKNDLTALYATEEQLLRIAAIPDLGIHKTFCTSAKTGAGLEELVKGMFAIFAVKKAKEEHITTIEADEPMKEAIRKVGDDSFLSAPLVSLQTKIQGFTPSARLAIGQASNTLVDELQRSNSSHDKLDAIQAFRTACNPYVQGPSKNIFLTAVNAVGIGSLVTLIAAMVGFGVGFTFGAWTGPGAFISAFAAAQAAAMLVGTGSVATGVVMGAYTTHQRLFKPIPEALLVTHVAQAAETLIIAV